MSLTSNQDQAIAVLLSGATCQEAAAAAGVRPETISRWKRLPDFAAAIAYGRAQLAESSADDLAALREKALGAIGDALENEEVNIRLRAAALVMPRSGAPITVNATASANAAAAAMPELSVEDAVAHLLAAPRTLARAIGCGVIPDSMAVRAAIHDGAKQLAALASGASTLVNALPEGSSPDGNLLGPARQPTAT